MLDLSPLILANASASAESTGLGLMVILFSAAVIATVFRRLKLQIIPGYIVAGALVGFVAQRFQWSLGDLESISQFATILLLFTIGLQLELGELRRSMVSIIGVGVGSTLAVAAACWAAGAIFGLSGPTALAIGLAMSISSTAILLRVLQERRELHQTHGRLCVGVSIAQDLLSILMLGALPAIAAWTVVDDGSGPGQPSVPQMLLSAGIGTLGVIVMLILGRTALPWILALVADIGSRGMAGRSGFGSRELVLVASAAIALGAAVVTKVLGFSAELGAFLAGLLLAFTPFRTQLAGQFEPLRDLLMAIFFTTVGLLLNVPDIAAMIVPILAGVLVLFVIKIVVIGLFAWGFGSSGSLSALAAIYLGNAGEFSLVLLAAAGRTTPVPILNSAELSAAIAVVVLSLFLSPFAFTYAHEIAKRLQGVGPPGWTKSLREKIQHDAAQSSATESPSDAPYKPVLRHVVIAGFGPVGRHLAARLSIQKISYTVIELNPSTVKRQSQLGKSIIYGDVTTPEVLDSAGMRHADAFVLTIPDDDASHRAIAIARQLSPKVFIACRTSYLSGAFRAYEAGADHAVVEEVVTADAMENQIFEKIEERWKAPRPAAT
ncbi:MAG: cation:proton antiporter [Phycisphaerales bacterium]|nr:cation:proton antiporter [Phycisphaerales bacterium]